MKKMFTTQFFKCCTIVLCIIVVIVYGKKQLKLKIDRFDGTCRRNKDTKITYQNYANRMEDNGSIVLNYTIRVKEDLANRLNLTFRIKRCRSKENPDSCELFHSIQADYCDLMATEMWEPMFDNTKPKMSCPMKKGFYKTENAMYDVSAMLLFPVDGWYWKIVVEMFDAKTGKKIMCIITDFNLQIVKI